MDNTALTIGEIVLYSVVGLLVVIAFLAVLAIAVNVISKLIRSLTNRPAEAAPTAAAAPAPAPVAAAAAPVAVPVQAAAPAAGTVVGTTGELKLKNVDDRTAAILMAIISDQTHIPLNQLRFKRIARVDSDQ